MKKTDNANNRRKINKLLIGGGVIGTTGALNSSWIKPVTNAVMIPAHAETSSPSVTPGPGDLTGPAPAPQPQPPT